jgi:hypothetical protein
MNDKAESFELTNPVESLPATNPMEMLGAAIDRGMSVADLGPLMDLVERHEANQARKAFAAAMAEFQAACPIIKKTGVAEVRTKSGGKWTYPYPKFNEIMRTIQPHLNAAGLSVRFNTETEGAVITSACTVTHVGGHSEVSYFAAPVDEQMRVNDTQKMGSANSYAKRYNVGNALNLAFEDDDDGASAGPAPLDDEQKKLQKKERAERPPQDEITDKQRIKLQDHLDSGKLSVRDFDYIKKNLDTMSKLDAAEILRTLALEQSEHME